ncbi:MAG: hypothetical protein GF350_01755 [Chitinivibrionales bacterium]|nr:hypothetical protein [Chitinivibrionales bacterium]
MKRKKLIVPLLIIAALHLSSPAENKFGLDLGIISLGMWITTNDNTGDAGKDSYFNTANLSLYYHIGAIKAYAGFPVMVTFEDFGDSLRYALYPADFSFYFGKRFGPVEPRLGLAVPMGYPTANIAWIGSKNLKLLTGLGYRIGAFFNDKLTIGGEFLGRLSVTGIPEGGRFGLYSFSSYLSIAATLKLSQKIRAGLELFPQFSYYTDTDWGTPEWKSAGLLPSLTLKILPTNKTEIGLKAGYGKAVSGIEWENNQTVISAGASYNAYLW